MKIYVVQVYTVRQIGRHFLKSLLGGFDPVEHIFVWTSIFEMLYNI